MVTKGVYGTNKYRMNAYISSPYNDSNLGYYQSEMNQTRIGRADTIGSFAYSWKQLFFGNHLATHKVWMSNKVNAVGGGISGANGGAWYDTEASLLSTADLLGSNNEGNQYDYGNQTDKLPLFNFESFTSGASYKYYWLRDIGSAPGFNFMTVEGPESVNISSSECNNNYYARFRIMLI